VEDPEDGAMVREADDHFSPLPPEQYIRLRVYPIMTFYRKRFL